MIPFKILRGKKENLPSSIEQGNFYVTTDEGKLYMDVDNKRIIINSFSKQDIVNLIYPIGSIYITAGNDKPADKFGGTWEIISNGRVLWGIDEDTTAGETLEQQLPDPKITTGEAGQKKVDFKGIKGFGYKQGGKSNCWGIDYGTHELYEQANFNETVTASKHTHSVTIGSNVYIADGIVRPNAYTVHMWQRIG